MYRRHPGHETRNTGHRRLPADGRGTLREGAKRRQVSDQSPLTVQVVRPGRLGVPVQKTHGARMVGMVQLHHGLRDGARYDRIRGIPARREYVQHRLRDDGILAAGDGALAVDNLLRSLALQLVAGDETGAARLRGRAGSKPRCREPQASLLDERAPIACHHRSPSSRWLPVVTVLLMTLYSASWRA